MTTRRTGKGRGKGRERAADGRPSGAVAVPGWETGVFLAVNAIENSVLVMNSPRCPFVRGLKVFLHNDVASTVYRADGRHRVLTTEWMTYEDVGGNEEAFARLLRDLPADAARPWVFAFQNVSSLVSGFDLAGVAREAGTKPKRILVPVEGPRLDEDWLDGYDAVVAAALGRVLGGKGARVELLLAGNLFCRNEADETANVEELRRLLSAVGVARPAIALSGGELAATGLRPRRVLAMPYAGRRTEASLAAAAVGVERIGLPVGLAGTAEWLRSVGKALGRSKAAEAFVERELSALVPQIQWLVAEHLAGRTIALVAEPHLGRALAGFLRELGLTVEGWFNTSRTPVADPGCACFERPTAEDFASFLDERRPDLVLGSSAFAYVAAGRGVPYLELGFPSYLTHCLHPRPYLGFAGARCLVEALFGALLRRDQGIDEAGR